MSSCWNGCGAVVGQAGPAHPGAVALADHAEHAPAPGRPGWAPTGESPASWWTGSRLATMTRSCRPALAQRPHLASRRRVGGLGDRDQRVEAVEAFGAGAGGPGPAGRRRRGCGRCRDGRRAARRPGRRGRDGRSGPTPRRSTRSVRAWASRPRRARTTEASALDELAVEPADHGAFGVVGAVTPMDGYIEHRRASCSGRAAVARPGGLVALPAASGDCPQRPQCDNDDLDYER